MNVRIENYYKLNAYKLQTALYSVHCMGKHTLFQILGILLLLVLYAYAGKDTPIEIWDEGIYSNNALEMAQSNNYLVLQNNGTPSFYNTKPPLAIWMQSISISIFGINEFAVRFPSLVAILFVCLALIRFLNKYFPQKAVSTFAVLTLLTSIGFMDHHVGATGDLDALLCLWTTLLTLVLLDALLYTPEKRELARKIWIAGGFFICGFLTKSFAILLPLPGLFILVLLSGKTRQIIFNKHTWFVALASVLLICGYYWLVNTRHPGYFDKVWFSEVERLYKNIMPTHGRPWHFYFGNLTDRFLPWIYVLIPFFILNQFSRIALTRKLSLYCFLFSLVYLIMISIPKVKLIWYDAPIYPFLAILIGQGIHEIIQYSRQLLPSRLMPVMIALFVVFYLVIFARLMQKRSHFILEEQEREGFFIRESFRHIQPKRSIVLMRAEYPDYYDQLNFYRKKYRIDQQSDIQLRSSLTNLQTNDTLFICQPQLKDSLSLYYQLDTLYCLNGCLMLRVGDRLKHNSFR